MSQAASNQTYDTPAVEKPTTGKTKLPPEVADRLLDLLSTSDEFRELFKRDPVAALIEAGHVFPVSQQAGPIRELQFFPGLYCFLVGELASKEEIAATRQLIHSYLMSSAAHTVIFAFESTKIESTLRRI